MLYSPNSFFCMKCYENPLMTNWGHTVHGSSLQFIVDNYLHGVEQGLQGQSARHRGSAAVGLKYIKYRSLSPIGNRSALTPEETGNKSVLWAIDPC